MSAYDKSYIAYNPREEYESSPKSKILFRRVSAATQPVEE
jgi:hypothetical protein